MLFDHADHEPQKISRRQAYLTTRNRELVSLTTERTDGSATRDREVSSSKRFRWTLLGGHPCTVHTVGLMVSW